MKWLRAFCYYAGRMYRKVTNIRIHYQIVNENKVTLSSMYKEYPVKDPSKTAYKPTEFDSTHWEIAQRIVDEDIKQFQDCADEFYSEHKNKERIENEQSFYESDIAKGAVWGIDRVDYEELDFDEYEQLKEAGVI